MSDRARWAEHAAYGGPASLILEIHDSFRGASAFLRRESERAVPNWEAVRRTFAQLASVLHHHHHAEEVGLFPRLARAGTPPDALEADHRALLAAIGAVERALAAGQDAPEAIARMDELLGAHLEAEEAVAVPYLLEHPHW